MAGKEDRVIAEAVDTGRRRRDSTLDARLGFEEQFPASCHRERGDEARLAIGVAKRCQPPIDFRKALRI